MKPNFSLPSDIVTPQDLASVMLDIKRYNKWYQSEVIKQRTNVPSSEPMPEVSTAASSLLSHYAQDGQLSSQSLADLQSSLEYYKKHTQIITITLADIPSRPLRIELAQWCRNNIASDILIQFSCNSRILGGMVVRYGSHMFDWSFRTKLLANKSVIPEVLRRV